MKLKKARKPRCAVLIGGEWIYLEHAAEEMLDHSKEIDFSLRPVLKPFLGQDGRTLYLNPMYIRAVAPNAR